MAEVAHKEQLNPHPTAMVADRYRLLQAALLGLRAGPALILLLLVVRLVRGGRVWGGGWGNRWSRRW